MATWQTVYKDNLEYRAAIVRDVLKDSDIDAVLLNKQDSAYKFGLFEVRVSQDNVLTAMKIINEDINFE